MKIEANWKLKKNYNFLKKLEIRIATLNETIDHKFQIHNAPNEASKIAFFFDFFGVSVPVVTGTKFGDLLVNCISKKIFLMKLIKYPNN